ncbi:MAG: hypothetical protein JSV21_07800 [Nitrospirota bacterium]|nr:MAG: hypothetical protein JSV21_07800 [Nitrospirota bacterium]
MKRTFWVALLICTLLIASISFAAQTDEEFQRAIELYTKGQFTDVIDLLSDYVDRKPEPSAYWLIGYSLYKLERFEEADGYFQDAYLIDPNFSPKQIEAFAPGLEELYKSPEEFEKDVSVPEEAGPMMPTFEPDAQAEGEQVGDIQQQAVEPAAQPAPQAVQPQAQSQPAPQAVQPQAPIQPAPQVAPQAPAQPSPPVAVQPRQPVRPPTRTVPGGPQQLPAGDVGAILLLIAPFMMIILIVFAVLYIYYWLCFFIMARKQGLPVPWLAFIPVAQLYTFVSVAGKPWWWIILLFVPLVNMIVVIYLWMCIAENMGRSKWLGLLILVPVINIILPALLAFTGSASGGGGEDFGGDDFGGGSSDFGGGDFGGDDFGGGSSDFGDEF